MSQPLFRTEVLQARRQPWLGAVSLDQPPAARWLAALAALACFGVALGLTQGEYTRRTRVVGQLVPSLGVSSVTAPVAGTVARLPVLEGQRVLAGDPVAVIAIPGATRRGGTGEALASSLQQRRDGLRATYAAQRRRLLADLDAIAHQRRLVLAELAGLDAELETRRRQQTLAEATLSRYRRLQAQHFVAELQLQQQESAALEQRASLQSVERQALALRRQLAQFDQAVAAAPAQHAQLEADEAGALALLAQEDTQLLARRESLVQAPLTGAVATLLVQPGQAVQASQPLLSLLPAASTLEAHLQVPGHAIGFVAPGDRVLLRYAAYPFQKYGQQPGRVLRVSAVAMPSADPSAEPVFRVVVMPERQSITGAGRDQALRAGLLLEAHLLGERRRLWEWVLEPLQTLRAAVAGAAPATRGGAKEAAAGVGDRRSARANPPSARRGVFAAARCDAGSRGSAPSPVHSTTGSTDVDDRLAADPGRRDVLRPPAIGGRHEGACDA